MEDSQGQHSAVNFDPLYHHYYLNNDNVYPDICTQATNQFSFQSSDNYYLNNSNDNVFPDICSQATNQFSFQSSDNHYLNNSNDNVFPNICSQATNQFSFQSSDNDYLNNSNDNVFPDICSQGTNQFSFQSSDNHYLNNSNDNVFPNICSQATNQFSFQSSDNDYLNNSNDNVFPGICNQATNQFSFQSSDNYYLNNSNDNVFPNICSQATNQFSFQSSDNYYLNNSNDIVFPDIGSQATNQFSFQSSDNYYLNNSNDNVFPNIGSQATNQIPFQSSDNYAILESSTISISSNTKSPFGVGPSSPFCNQIVDLKQSLIACAEAISCTDIHAAQQWLSVLEPMVSVCGEPVQRMGAYLLEGLKARMLSSGSIIYKKLKCNEPTGPELMTYMHLLYQICPFYKFAYNTTNVSILEAMENEKRIHIIDFQLAQGSQWISLLKALSERRNGLPYYVRVTGVDDSQSAIARGGGLDVVGRKLSEFASSLGLPFEFHGAAMDGCQVRLENLCVQTGEALAVNFPYMLHHMPDESVTTINHRDRLIRLVKGLSPKIVTLVEQESNTNTSSFVPRFKETMDYYMAMFEAIDVARPKDDKQRMSAEEHCVARDIVNMVACEGVERIERHEPLGKWRCRLTMAGFEQLPLSTSVCKAVTEVLVDYSNNYRAVVEDGAIYLGWKNRHMATSSGWR